MSHSLEYTLEEASIKSLLIRERLYRDTGRLQRMREAYHPDNSRTYVHITWYKGEIDGWIEGTKNVVGNRINTIHNLTPVDIDIRGRKAFAESLCTMTTRLEKEGREYDKVSTVRLLSRLEKLDLPEGQQWKILSLECVYIRDCMIPVAPLPYGEVGAQFEGSEKLRSSYRYSAWLINSTGLAVADDLPGEDRPDLVKEVFARNYEWLSAP